MKIEETTERLLNEAIEWVIADTLAEGYTDDMLVDAYQDEKLREQAKEIIRRLLDTL